MKKYLFVLLAFTCISCGGNNGGNESNASENGMEASQEQLDGAKLISKSDCMACHAEKEKLIGPGYMEVAARYPKNDSTINFLAGKIINGGSGNWGEVPMTPHPQLSKEEAEAMARYVLSLKQ